MRPMPGSRYREQVTPSPCSDRAAERRVGHALWVGYFSGRRGVLLGWAYGGYAKPDDASPATEGGIVASRPLGVGPRTSPCRRWTYRRGARLPPRSSTWHGEPKAPTAPTRQSRPCASGPCRAHVPGDEAA